MAGFPAQLVELRGAYVGQFVIVFRRLDLTDNRDNRNLYFILGETLHELLKKAGSSDALFATLCVTAPETEEARAPEPSLVLQLEAIGNTPEQAALRWGLGLVVLQEALVSASLLLSQHLAKTSPWR